MARILIISKNFTETGLRLAKSLSDQQNEVIFLTGRNEPIPDSLPRVQMMAYFRDWNVLESLKLLPRLISIKPQIVHLLLAEDEVLLSQILITLFVKFFPNSVIATSILHIKKGLSLTNPVRYLVEESDIVTCPSSEALHHLKGIDVRNKRQGRGVFAPALELTRDSSDKIPEPLYLNYISDKKYILVPFLEKAFDRNADFYKRLAFVMKSHFVLLNGSQKNWSYFERNKFNYWMEAQGFQDRWALTGLDPYSLSGGLLNGAKALWLAGLSLNPEELTQYYKQIIQVTCPLILDSSQSAVHATLWRNGLNCWIIEKNKFNMEFESLLSKENFFLRSKMSEQVFLQKEAFDTPLNELNRLYSRALKMRYRQNAWS